MSLTHFNEYGKVRMVSVEEKNDTKRVAIALATITMKPDTLDMIVTNGHKKGDVLGVAQVAGIMAAKRTSDLIPMCHNIFLSGADIYYEIDVLNSCIYVKGIVKTFGKTGVEMEVLTAVSITALTIYDMCKAVDKDMVVSNVKLIEKSGGKSGKYIRKGE